MGEADKAAHASISWPLSIGFLIDVIVHLSILIDVEVLSDAKAN
jgi:hypothetical protein